MTTSRKLWLGFGTLTALLVLFGLTVLLRVRAVEAQAARMATVARQRGAATRELESAVLHYGLAVRTFVQGVPEAPQEAAEQARRLERSLGEYGGYAETERQRQLAGRFAEMWERLSTAGRELLDGRDSPDVPGRLATFRARRIDLGRLLSEEMQPDAFAAFTAGRDAALGGLRDVLSLSLTLLLAGTAVAVVTAAAVGRAVVRDEESLRESEERYRALIEVSPQAVWAGRADGHITYCNQHWLDYTGLTMEQSAGDGWTRAVHPDHRERVLGVWRQAWATGAAFEVEVPFRRGSDGEYRWHLAKGQPVRDGDGRVLRWTGIAVDVHDLRRAERLAAADGLTGLRNRRAFDGRLAEEVARAARHGTPLSLLLLDVDHFKQFNDAFGHPAGDGVLRGVARLLEETARTTDFVARYGGEEFAVLLPNTDGPGATVVADRFREAVAGGPWPERAITVSVGAATWSPPDRDGSAMLARADAALYRSKKRGRDRVSHADEPVLAAV